MSELVIDPNDINAVDSEGRRLFVPQADAGGAPATIAVDDEPRRARAAQSADD